MDKKTDITETTPPRLAQERKPVRRIKQRALLEKKAVFEALKQACTMLRPDIQWKNPVTFIVEIGAILILLFILEDFFIQNDNQLPVAYFITLDIWLFLTVIFANFATALAETRGKAQANSLRSSRREMMACRINSEGGIDIVPSSTLNRGDRVVVKAGQMIPSDGEILEGVSYINESAITGESAPVLRESGSDHSGVTAGTMVLSDSITIEITSNKGHSFLDRMISLVEGAIRQRTANEMAIATLLSAFSLAFLIVVIPLWPMSYNAELYMMKYLDKEPLNSLGTNLPTLIALLVCLIPTTIGALLSAIGIAGMDRALQANIIANSGKAIELAGDIDVVLFDKTGTITVGNRHATKFLSIGKYSEEDFGKLAATASISDSTPEGKSILKLFKADYAETIEVPQEAKFIPFSAKTRLSGVNLPNNHKIRKGAPDAIIKFIQQNEGIVPEELAGLIEKVSSEGATPLVVAENNQIAGLIVLEDVLKPNMPERFARLRKMGLKTIMITGDNARTAQAIVEQVGIDEFLAEAKPEDKLAFIRKQQAEGKLVAMMGDGTNDAPALAQADVALAMNAGTQAAKDAANMVDLDSDPTKLIEVIEIGKQLLITRGALTTFSMTNDVAKYFAIIPALFSGTLPWLKALDIMHLHSSTSAILSTVIFNAVVIPALIPIAIKGVRYRALGADALLRRNLLIWGGGGIILPFVAIKLIDLVMVHMNLIN